MGVELESEKRVEFESYFINACLTQGSEKLSNMVKNMQLVGDRVYFKDNVYRNIMHRRP